MGLEHEVKTLELTVIERDLEIVRVNGELSQCRGKIESNNERIADLKVHRDQQEKSFTVLAESLEAFKTVSGVQIQELQNTEAPQSCELIMSFLRKGVGPQ